MSTHPPFWSAHTHSRFSANDALSKIEDLVAAAVDMDYPALGLTDHGTVAGNVQLYKACRKAGIEPLPGVEAYVQADSSAGERKYQHLTINAYTPLGYRNLCKLQTLANRNFYFRPRLDMGDLADLSEHGLLKGLAVSTGCFFGLVQVTLRQQGYGPAMRLVKALDGWFDRCYVELQHHGVHDAEHDADRSIAVLVDMADELGLPYIVTSDAHYTYANQRPIHDGLKRMVSFSDDPDDAIFPGIGSYHLPDAAYLRRFIEPDVMAVALANLAQFAQDACVRIPELERFSLRCPDITYGGDPDAVLKDLVDTAWAKSTNWGDHNESYRISEELDVITSSGMAGYILLVADVCRFMLEKGIWFHARGSASGSLVCRLLGITQIDPMAWGLRFDRFLSRDRTRPPDVDLDVEHRRRHEVAEYLEAKYVVRQIATHMTYSIKGEEEEGDESVRGSLMIRYGSLANKRGQKHRSWHEIPPKDQYLLRTLGDMELFSGYGTHPAGFVVADSEEVIDQLPLTYIASSKTLVTTYDKKDIESLGMVKLDVLGLKDITASRLACEIAGIDPRDIPMNDKATFERISQGKTDGVFQLKGIAMKRGCESIRPRRIEDLAAAQALFRPAAMHSGATAEYRARRLRKEAVPERHGDIMAECKDTYGVLLYQEQVIGVLRRMSMPAEELTDMLDAVKSSGKRGVLAARETIARMTPRIGELASTRGWNDEDIRWLADALVAYADYCVTGDTVVVRGSGGRGQKAEMTVKELHDIWHGPSTAQQYQWRTRGLHIMARDAKDGRIRPDRVLEVMHKGVRPVWAVRTEGGHEIVATANHKHLTDRGWVRVDELTLADSLAVMGEREIFANSQNTGSAVGVHDGTHLLKREIRAAKRCERCGTRDGRLELAHLDSDRSNNTRENLALLCNSCHKKHDWDTGVRRAKHSRGRPALYSKITDIVYDGEQEVYDLSMAGDDHSWVGNFCITSNSFNKAHAATYAEVAYRSAYLAEHHPVAFWAGMLEVNAGLEPEKWLVRSARANGVRVVAPHVNRSKIGYTADVQRNAVRRGLISIKGVGPKAAAELAEKGPFASLKDLGQRCTPRAVPGAKRLALGDDPETAGGVIAALYEAGALDNLD